MRNDVQATTRPKGCQARKTQERPHTASAAVFGMDPFQKPDDRIVLHVLASGSKGNAAVVQCEDHAVLIDCGISKKEFFSRCDLVGFDPAALDAILITHDHSDHTSGLGVLVRGLAKQGITPPVMTTPAVHAASSRVKEAQEVVRVEHVGALDAFDVACFHIASFPTSHDSAESMGFRFEVDREDGCRDALGFATDTGTLSDEAIASLENVRLLALESNHDSRMLETGPYPAAIKRRVASSRGHLSNEQSAAYLERLLCPRLERIVGMHLSAANNLPRLAEASARSVLERNGHGASYYTACQALPITVY